MRQTHLALLVLVGLAGAAAPASAQVHGLPVYNSGIPTGLGIYGDVAFPNDNAGGGTTFGGTARLGLGPFGVTGTVAYLDGEDSSENLTGVGGTLNYKFFGGPLVPLAATLQAGAGYVKFDSDFREYRFPVGVGLALTIPNPVLAIKPWLAPRLDIVRRSPPDTGPLAGDAETDTNFGLSGGVELNLLSGLGLHAAYDRVFVETDDPSVFAVGLHYTFRVPGL
ncbi:MAG TPA: outer membrane beta-barrel protein [Gemmatimonadales bacterium]|nr:outer membrane beta-barrel protein [Gemmatimonadales bacterium]